MLKAANSVVSSAIWPKFELVPLPASIKRIGSKTTEKRWRHRFPHYNRNQSFDPICPKKLCSLSPKIGQLASDIFKFESVDDDDERTTDHWYTISSPCEPSAQVS